MANKAELVSEVASKTKLTKKQVANTVDAILDSIQENLAKGEKVQLIGFGTFEVRHRAARKSKVLLFWCDQQQKEYRLLIPFRCHIGWAVPFRRSLVTL